MATISQGGLGGFSGKLGPVVGYSWRGRWCMRGRPLEVRNPRTEAQQRHRLLFREEVRLASRLNWVLRESLEELSMAEGLTPCNYFIKENQRCFGWEEERLTMEWSQLVLSHGPVAPVAFDAPVVTEGTRLHFAFEKNPLHVRANALDKVYLYIYCTGCEEGFLTAPVYRCDQEINVLLPSWWAGREVQLWGLVQDPQGRWSETIYVGYGPLEEGASEDSENSENSEYSEYSEYSDYSEYSEKSDNKEAAKESPPGEAGEEKSRKIVQHI